MKRILGTALVCGMAATGVFGRQARDAGAQLPQASGTGVVAGTVVMADAGAQPVRRARVTLNSVDRSTPGQTVTTDDAGRFVFVNVAAGRLNLDAAKPGYLTGRYGARLPDRPGTPITVVAGQRLAGLTLRMTKGGVITGVVRDQNAQPAPGVGVSVLRYGYSPLTGERTLSSSSSGATDDRGVYRVYGLLPGEYVVMARVVGRPGEDIMRLTAADIQRALSDPGRPTSVAVGGAASGSSGSRVTFAPVFFPGSTDPSLATSLMLAAGEERGGVDFPLKLMPTARIEGTINIPAGAQVGDVLITVAPTGPQAEWLSGPDYSVRVSGKTTFAFDGVGPGSYAVKAKPFNPGGRPPASGAFAQTLWGRTDIVVDGHDLQVAVDLQPGLTIAGRVEFEGAAPDPSDLTKLKFILAPAAAGSNIGAGPAGGEVDASGKFSFVGATPDRYRLVYTSLLNASSTSAWTRTGSLKSAIAAGRDLLEGTFEIKPGDDLNVVVTFTDRPSELGGTLQDTSGRAAPDYFIIVFAADKAFWTPASRRVRMIRPGNDGQFTVAGLPPGEYRVAALTDVINGEWYNPTFLDGLLPSSVKVVIVEGQKTTQNLKIGG